jgi:outer membrane cobalamin receptor
MVARCIECEISCLRKPRARFDSVSVRCEFQLRAAECRESKLARRDAFGGDATSEVENRNIADPEDANTTKRLPRRAKLHGAFKASGNVFGVNTGVEVVASGDRFDNASNTRRLAGYGIVNAFARYEVMRGVGVGLRVDNAFDRAYENSRGYSTGGRRAWITLDISQQ